MSRRTCNPEQIIQKLRQKGYHILEAVNILKWKTKEPLPIFMLTFDRTENIQKIYEISNIRGMRVEVTPYRKTGLLPQRKNCQSWGHTKSYCHKESRCVKWAGKHSTESCSKTKEVPPKCYDCGENHPANYRGCVVAKEPFETKRQTRLNHYPRQVNRLHRRGKNIYLSRRKME